PMFKTKIRAKAKGSVTSAIALINHPMESGLNKPGQYEKPAPCNHITEIFVEYRGIRVFTAHLSGAVSRDPFFSFNFPGGKRGETLRLYWQDNNGETGSTRTTIS
ncbi:MAG: thiosulfate oxidation carrier complex protein SoxZ, partial [Pseudomonadota bacterium]